MFLHGLDREICLLSVTFQILVPSQSLSGRRERESLDGKPFRSEGLSGKELLCVSDTELVCIPGPLSIQW
jgi:hypothetical protein